MTKETKVLDSTVFMSLSNTAEEWTDEILTNLKDYKKELIQRVKYLIMGLILKLKLKKMMNFYGESGL